jgi:cysteine-rich repeat protein
MRTLLRSFSAASLLGGLWWVCAAPVGCGGTSEPSEPAQADPDSGILPEEPERVCGNGIIETPELCDDGNDVNGDGCEADCTKTCVQGSGDTCSDGNPCNGTEVCGAASKCDLGTPLADGATCGDGKICKDQKCIDSVCGDLLVANGEECDDGNADNGDGCDSCRFSCLSTDPARGCVAADPCLGTATCDDATHTCKQGTPLANGSACGTGKICKDATCVDATCGDGFLTGTEVCDFGTSNGPGAGCELDCKLSCDTDADCDDRDPCSGVETCVAVTVDGKNGKKCQAGTRLPNKTACGGGNECKDGACAPPSCGNGTLDEGEDCDFGTGKNGAGTGCEANCKFSCATTANCDDGNACNGFETCVAVTVDGKNGRKCQAGTALAACAACASGSVCLGGVCRASTCGDGCVDETKGEQCEPRGTATCDDQCKAIVCGDGKRSRGETCDDGATANLDGCDATCQFEQSHRANQVRMVFNVPTGSLCTKNQLGSAIAGAAQSTIQNSLNDGVADGSISIMFKFLGLDDLSGTADPSVRLASITGAPLVAFPNPNAAPNGASGAVDWWYKPDAQSIDDARNAVATLDGAIAAKRLTAGPGNMILALIIGGGAPSKVNLSAVRIRATIGNASVPRTSTGSAPGHLASSNLDPSITSFETMSNGELCGNVSAASLRTVPVPDALLNGVTRCNQGYRATDNLLDVLVGGCNALLNIPAITARQPDEVDPTAPAVGAGGPYTLVRSTSNPPKVTGCRDRNGQNVDLEACLKAAAYSSSFTFTTQRVIIKGGP